MAVVWVFVREFDGAPTPLALELLTKARQVGDTTAVYVGTGSEEAFARLGEYGAKNVLHLDPKDSLVAAPVARAMAERLETTSPTSSSSGRPTTIVTWPGGWQPVSAVRSSPMPPM